MRSRVFVPLLLASAQVATAGDTTWVKRFTFTDPSKQWNISGVCTINADAQALVFARDERRAVPRNEPSLHELVYVDLSTGREQAVLRLPGPESMRFGISANGQAVAIVRKRNPMSIWRPFGEEQGLKDYGPRVFEFAQSKDRSEAIDPALYADPVFSPDGRSVAYAGVDRWWTAETGEQGYHDAVGVLDLREGKAFAIALPYSTDPGIEHLWHLSWSADGSSVWVTAHGDYESDAFEKVKNLENALAPVQKLPPDWTLFQCSVADRKAAVVGPVPPSILGIDQDGEVVVSDVDREAESRGPFWWHRTGFGRIPMGELQEGTNGKPEAARALALAAKTAKVVPAGGGDFRLERVFIGRSHTYVIGILNKVRVVLEKVSPESQTK